MDASKNGGFSKNTIDHYKNSSLIDIYKSTNFYKRFKKPLSEGLIMTHPPSKTLEILRRAGYNFYLSKEEDAPYGVLNTFVVDIDAYDNIKQKNDLLRLTNNLGYFPSAIILDNNHHMTYSESNFVDATESGAYSIEISFEPKYDYEINLEELSKKSGGKLYHVTPKKHIEKIKKIGLTPRSESKRSYHPDRVYLTYLENAAFEIADQLGSHEGDDMVKIIIDINKLRSRVKFYVDVNFFPIGIYTMDNISPKSFSKIVEL